MQTSYLITEQGSGEQRIELCREHCERVAETVTQLCIKSNDQNGGFAADLGVAVWSLR